MLEATAVLPLGVVGFDYEHWIGRRSWQVVDVLDTSAALDAECLPRRPALQRWVPPLRAEDRRGHCRPHPAKCAGAKADKGQLSAVF